MLLNSGQEWIGLFGNYYTNHIVLNNVAIEYISILHDVNEILSSLMWSAMTNNVIDYTVFMKTGIARNTSGCAWV